jgi:hypothetical protein
MLSSTAMMCKKHTKLSAERIFFSFLTYMESLCKYLKMVSDIP